MTSGLDDQDADAISPLSIICQRARTHARTCTHKHAHMHAHSYARIFTENTQECTALGLRNLGHFNDVHANYSAVDRYEQHISRGPACLRKHAHTLSHKHTPILAASPTRSQNCHSNSVSKFWQSQCEISNAGRGARGVE